MSEEILRFSEKDLDSLCAFQEYKIYWVICSCLLEMEHFILLILLILIFLIIIINIIIIVVIVVIVIDIGVVMMIP